MRSTGSDERPGPDRLDLGRQAEQRLLAVGPPDELVGAVAAFAEQALDPLRDGETFAAAVDAPEGATPIQRLAAYTGRPVAGGVR